MLYDIGVLNSGKKGCVGMWVWERARGASLLPPTSHLSSTHLGMALTRNLVFSPWKNTIIDETEE